MTARVAPAVATLAAALASACYQPAPRAGAPCAPAGAAARCPEGQVCAAQAGGAVCVAPGAATDAGGPADADARAADAAGPPDQDGDGVADAEDDCPRAADPGQADEDGDGAGDACDPCPPFADGASPADADHDGLPDACDPFPDTPGDRLALFEGFAAGVPGAWTTTAGWSASAGDAVATAPTSSLAAAVLPTAAGFDPSGRYTLSTELTASAASRLMNGIGVTLQHAPARGISCGTFSDLARSPSDNLALYALDQQKYLSKAAMPQQVGHRYLLAARRDASDRYGCTAVDRTAATPALSAGTTYATAPGAPALTLLGATARYHWVMLVTSP